MLHTHTHTHTHTQTNKHTGHLMRGTVDQVGAGKEKQTALDQELHVQTHKSRPDLLAIFSLLLGRR